VLHEVTAALEHAGFSPADITSRAALVEFASSALRRLSPHAPFGTWFVPGRIEIVGKHTDYAGGRSLVAAVPRGMAIVAAPRDDGRLRVIDAREPRLVDLHPAALESAGGWAKYPAAVLRRLAANFPQADLGADLAFASDLPRAAGMSSSSALVVGIALALVARAGLEERAEWARAIADDLDLAGYLGAVENGRDFGTLQGLDGVGTEGGSQDHTAILASRAGQVSAFRYLPVRRLLDEPMPEHWHFVLMTSGVHASKAGSVRDRYNRASQAVAALVGLWQQDTGKIPGSLGALLDADPGAVAHLRRLAAQGAAGFSGGDLTRRLEHFVAEDARVVATARAFHDRDERTLDEISAASQWSAECELGNQVRETVELAGLARECGAFAASSFGAGFGGSVWALVAGDRATADAMAGRWQEAYAARCPHAHGVETLVTRPGPPALTLHRRPSLDQSSYSVNA
jgi:galactokinase